MAGRRQAAVVLAVAVLLVLGGVAGIALVRPTRHRFATLGVLTPAVAVRPAGVAEFGAGADGESLAIGAGLRTDTAGFASVDYFDGSITRLGANTQFSVTRLESRAGRKHIETHLDVGDTWSHVKKLTGDDSFQVDTPVGTAAVRGTTFRVRCAQTKACDFAVIEGQVLVTTITGQKVLLSPGEGVGVDASGHAGAIEHLDLTKLAADPFVVRNEQLDTGTTRATTTTIPPRAALIVVSGTPMETVDPDTGATKQLPISGDNPKWSPDRQHIAYDRGGDIYVANADGSGERAIVAGPNNDTDPSWSPDGRQIAFIRDEASVQGVNADGSGLRLIANAPPPDPQTPSNSYLIEDVAWSPDNTRIAFSVDNFRPLLTFVAPSGGGLVRTQRYVYDPDWSPDGTQMATGGRGSGCSFALYDFSVPPGAAASSLGQGEVPPGTRQVVDSGCSEEASGVWSPDGKRLAYIGQPPDDPSHPGAEQNAPVTVRVVNADGTNNHAVSAALPQSVDVGSAIDW